MKPRAARIGIGGALVLLGTLLALLGNACRPAPPTDREGNPLPDVVLILIDTLRPDHLPFHGYGRRDTAPFLTRLASRSTVFKHAFSTSSWTAPATASLFTSLYPPQHGVVEGFFAHRRRVEEVEQSGSTEIPVNRLARAATTLPQYFRSAGYTTLGLAANVNIGAEIGFERGFERFERVRAFEKPKDASAEDIEARLIEWEAQLDSDRPRFVYLHFNDVHYPYARREPWYERQRDELEDDRAGYDSEISYVDRVLERMFTQRGWSEDTIVMLVSDHGQEFMEHGRKGHKTSLYRELNQVLMMVHAPGRGIGAGLVEENVSLIDVLPTLVELANIDAAGKWEGRSLVALLPGREGDDAQRPSFRERTLFAHRVELDEDPIHLFAAIHGGWKLIQEHAQGEVAVELYDWIADPAEKTNLASQRTDLVETLNERLQEFQALTPLGTGEFYRFHLDQAALDELRSLGYVGGEEEGG